MEPATSSDQKADSQQVMTQEEKDVIALLAKGLTNLEIAARLGIDPIQTSLVKTDLLRRFGAKDETEMISMVNSRKLPEPPQETLQPDLEINKPRDNILMQVGIGLALFGCFGAYLFFSNLGRMFEGGDRMVVTGAAILLVALIAGIVWRKKWDEATKNPK